MVGVSNVTQPGKAYGYVTIEGVLLGVCGDVDVGDSLWTRFEVDVRATSKPWQESSSILFVTANIPPDLDPSLLHSSSANPSSSLLDTNLLTALRLALKPSSRAGSAETQHTPKIQDFAMDMPHDPSLGLSWYEQIIQARRLCSGLR